MEQPELVMKFLTVLGAPLNMVVHESHDAFHLEVEGLRRMQRFQGIVLANDST